MGIYLREYGVATTIDFVLFETDGVDFKVDAVHAAGDTKLMQDEGAEANTTNGFVDEGQGYSITFTAAEMQFARGVLYVVDQGAKAWLDRAFIIETYGSEGNSQHMINAAMIDTDLDSYQANFGMVIDSGPTNRYGVDFFKNGEPNESGITSPQIRIVKCSDGTDLVAWVAMTEVDAFGRYKYDEAVNTITAGKLYKVWIRATMGGALRYWDWHVYRDA